MLTQKKERQADRTLKLDPKIEKGFKRRRTAGISWRSNHACWRGREREREGAKGVKVSKHGRKVEAYLLKHSPSSVCGKCWFVRRLPIVFPTSEKESESCDVFSLSSCLACRVCWRFFKPKKEVRWRTRRTPPSRRNRRRKKTWIIHRTWWNI